MRLIVVCACCALAVLIFRIGIADAFVTQDPSKSLAWWPWHSEALLRDAQTNAPNLTVRRDALNGSDRARTLLRSNPLAGEAYSVLAQDLFAKGRVDDALTLMQLAAKYAPRERLVHIWLADYWVSKGDFAQALIYFDQLLRLTPRQFHTLSPALASIAKNPAGARALSNYIGSNSPDWRERFLTLWASQADTEGGLDLVFDELRSAAFPLTETERALWVARLVALGRVTKAHYLWIDGLPAELKSRVGNVFDGGFELPPSEGGFGWRFRAVEGVTVRRERAGGVEGHSALMVEFRNRRVPFDHVQQMLALPRGSYVLSGRVRLDDLRNERGLRWVIHCAAGNIVLLESERFTGRRTWSAFSQSFQVPSTGCEAQWLKLRLDARVPAEQLIGGRAWFDSLRIVREDEVGPDVANAAAQKN